MQRRLTPSIHALSAFEAAARHGSIVGAAEELHLSQSAVSRLVRQIEDGLRARLFDRVRQRLVLTRAGRQYADALGGIFRELERATQEARTAGGGASSLSLGVFSTFAVKWLIPRLPRFKAREPGIVVSCFVRSSPFDFEADRLDAAIHYGRPAWPGAALQPLFGEMLVPVARPDLPGIAAVADPGDLLGFPLLHEVTRPTAWREWFAGNGVDDARALHGARFDQFGMVAQAAIAGCGVALVPRFLIAEEIAAGLLRVPVARPVPGRHGYFLAYPHRNAGLHALDAFRQWLAEEIADGAAAPA